MTLHSVSMKNAHKKSNAKLPKREKSPIKMTRIDHTLKWTRMANKKRHFNRMDPDPDPPLDLTPEHHVVKDKTGKIKQVLTSEDWRTFWIDRIRRHYQVDAPSLTDKEIYGAVDRSRRIYLHHWEDNRRPHIDPDLPSCYYWDKFKVAQWFESIGVPEVVKDMFLHNDISGRRLITLDANTLHKMGLYELGTIKTITKAVRNILGLPNPNGLRAISRLLPLERFLHHKIRTGPTNEKLTFKQFCEHEKIEYEPAKKQKEEGYKKIPGCIKVLIDLSEKEDVKWVPVTPTHTMKPRNNLPYFPYTSSDYDIHLSPSGESSSSEESLPGVIPTVEELAQNAMLRNQFIPQILNDIVDAVYTEIRALNAQGKCRQEVADQILKERMQQAYSYFKIQDPEERLKFVTIIAEELADDVLKAREILEDIDKFQERIQREVPKQEMQQLQEAVAHYVQSIMPQVVNAALKELKESEEDLRAKFLKGEDIIFGRSDPNLYKDVKEICMLKEVSKLMDSDSDSEIELVKDDEESKAQSKDDP